MTIQQALNLGYKKTKSTLDSEVLLCYVLKKPKEHLFVHTDKKINRRQSQDFLKLISDRARGWPVAYLTGEKEFFGLKFFITKDVLIPRPETEGLVELVLSQIRIQNSKFKILDVGTGSGCIIVSLAKYFTLNPKPYTLFFASDISAKALAVARKNAKLHKVKVIFRQGSLLKPWKDKQFDIIVANLPYLSRLEDPSTKFEPRSALVAGKKGLAVYEQLFGQIPKSVKHIFIEIDPRQIKQIKKLAEKHLPACETKIYKDLSGRYRYFALSRSEA